MIKSTAALLVLLLLAGAGCSSTGRDYLSLNKSSWAFTKGTLRQSNEMRRGNLKRIDLGRIHAENKELRRTSRKFTRSAFLGDEKDRAREGWETFKWMLEWDRQAARESIRFGYLDSGG